MTGIEDEQTTPEHGPLASSDARAGEHSETDVDFEIVVGGEQGIGDKEPSVPRFMFPRKGDVSYPVPFQFQKSPEGATEIVVRGVTRACLAEVMTKFSCDMEIMNCPALAFPEGGLRTVQIVVKNGADPRRGEMEMIFRNRIMFDFDKGGATELSRAILEKISDTLGNAPMGEKFEVKLTIA